MNNLVRQAWESLAELRVLLAKTDELLANDDSRPSAVSLEWKS
jgi:hypothetical protein